MWVRTASERDLPVVQKLLRETWHATYDGIYGVERVNEITADWHSIANLKAKLSEPHSEFIVADGEDSIAGMAFASQSDLNFVTLHQIYVHPVVQGKGIGSMLLKEIIDAFPEGKALRLEVEPANARAVNFYRSKGFEPLGQTENCGGDSGIPALVLQRPIG